MPDTATPQPVVNRQWLMVSDLVSAVVFIVAQWVDNQAPTGSRAWYAAIEQTVISVASRMATGAMPDAYASAVKNENVRKYIVQAVASVISSAAMRRPRIGTAMLNSLGASCLSRDITALLTTSGDYQLI